MSVNTQIIKMEMIQMETKFKVPHKSYSIIELYEAVAKEMGYSNSSELEFDCRNINVAKNIQDGFYDWYTQLEKVSNPDVSETDVLARTTMLLAIAGPKVDENLANDEVEVFDGFIC